MLSGLRRWATGPFVRLRFGRFRAPLFEFVNSITVVYIRFLEIFFKRYLGRCLYCVVYGLLFLVITSEFLVVMPYENHVRYSPLIPMYIILAMYLIPNIFFHYYKSCTVDPGYPQQKNAEPRCFRCNNYKPERTHHCSICDRCVLHMDHHCVWINQCVGLRNHRYFFQFVVYVWLSMVLILFSNYNCFWEHINFLDNPEEMPFCVEDVELAPWRDWMCLNIGQIVSGCIFFDYGLAVLLFFVLGGFSLWLAYLISIGETLVELLQRSKTCPCVSRLRSSYDLGFVLNWKRFFGLTKGRTFFRHVLLPSSHSDVFDAFTFKPSAMHLV